MGWASEQFWRDLARAGIYPINKEQEEEYRCKICKEQGVCPAFETGVIYPCPYFKEDDHGNQG